MTLCILQFYWLPPPLQATLGASPLLLARGWGIATSGLAPGEGGRAKPKYRLISYPILTLSYMGDLGTRLLLILLVKHVNSQLTLASYADTIKALSRVPSQHGGGMHDEALRMSVLEAR